MCALDNLVVNQLFGTVSGLGMGIITFDWQQISWISSPLMVPWWAQIHVFGGFVLFYWFILPILYYTNVSSEYLFFMVILMFLCRPGSLDICQWAA